MKRFAAVLLLLFSSLSNAEWGYHTNKDKMSDKETTVAHLASDNIVELDFPYQEPQKGRLAIFRLPDNSLTVAFYVSHGQINCAYSSYYECETRIRFDSGSAQKWPYLNPRLSRNNSITLEQANGFIKQMSKSEKILLEIDFHGSGTRIFEFSPSGLDLNKIK